MTGDYDDLPPSGPVLWRFKDTTTERVVYVKHKVWFDARREAMRLLGCDANHLSWVQGRVVGDVTHTLGKVMR